MEFFTENLSLDSFYFSDREFKAFRKLINKLSKRCGFNFKIGHLSDDIKNIELFAHQVSIGLSNIISEDTNTGYLVKDSQEGVCLLIPLREYGFVSVYFTVSTQSELLMVSEWPINLRNIFLYHNEIDELIEDVVFINNLNRNK